LLFECGLNVFEVPIKLRERQSAYYQFSFCRGKLP